MPLWGTIIDSDQVANLVSEVIKSLCATLGINRTQTTAYHPEGNGQVERFNRTLESMLAKVIADHQRDWDEHIQIALFAYRTAIHDSKGYTPFLVMFGRSPTLPIDVMLGQGEEQVMSRDCNSHFEPHSLRYVNTWMLLTNAKNKKLIS